jgi:CHAD domain-containing protein
MKRRAGNWELDAPVTRNLRRELPRFTAEYFEAGRKAAAKGARAELLHEFRLLTKHFRYLIEMFSAFYDKKLSANLKKLRQVQTLLGEFNDYAVTRAMLAGSPEASTEAVQELFRYLARQKRKKRVQFRRYWTEEVDAEGELRRWSAFFRRPRGD